MHRDLCQAAEEMLYFEMFERKLWFTCSLCRCSYCPLALSASCPCRSLSPVRAHVFKSKRAHIKHSPTCTAELCVLHHWGWLSLSFSGLPALCGLSSWVQDSPAAGRLLPEGSSLWLWLDSDEISCLPHDINHLLKECLNLLYLRPFLYSAVWNV